MATCSSVSFYFNCLLIIINFYTEVKSESTLQAIVEARLIEEAKMNFTQLAEKYGRPAQQHSVVTEDGYIITVFRLPGSRPVLLWHGIGDTSDVYILKGRESLAMTLCHQGYDVWVGNSRGNRYARRHVRLNPDTDMKFWDYSFEEIGFYDLAATIDYIRNKTGEDSVSIIGHSQGATIQYVLASLRPEYNSRIKISIGLSPGIIYTSNSRRPMPLAITFSTVPVIDALLPSRFQELFGEDMSNLIKFFCTNSKTIFNLCGKLIMGYLTGPNTEGFRPEFLHIIMGHAPSSISRKSFMHYDQMILRQRFSRYDYGSRKNLEVYGSAVPPDYDLGKVTMPTALFEGKSDTLVTVRDVAMLRARLPNVVHFQEMAPDRWNHLDFVWGAKMTEHLFPSLLRILEKFNLPTNSDSNSIIN